MPARCVTGKCWTGFLPRRKAGRKTSADPALDMTENRTKLGEFDYVIVGAGSAGCVLANRLSADPSIRVCLLEAGGKDSHPWIHILVGYFFNFDHPRADWRYRTEPEPGLNGRVLKNPRGRVLGGTSSINGMASICG